MPDELPRALLSRYPAHVQPAGVVTALGNAGGASGAGLWRYPSAIGELVGRAWPVGVESARLVAIHGWLGRCKELPFIPRPIPARDGRTFCLVAGRHWEIGPWMPGEADLGDPPAEGHVAAAFGALAELHRRLGEGSTVRPSPGLGRRVRELDELLAGGFERMRAAIEAQSGDTCAEAGRRWLTLAGTTLPRLLPELRDRARLAVLLQPCLRDARPEHFLFRGEVLTGLVDFGAMGVDTVAGDLARLLGEWLPGQPGLRAAALDAYASVRPLDAFERVLIDAFEAIGDVLIAGHWLIWHFLEHRRFDAPGAVMRGVARGLARIERASRDRVDGI